MDTLYIFGDSFADPSSNISDPYAWTNRLADNYKVKNFALNGTGPDWSLDLFLKQIENLNADKTNYCIFCISDIYRLNMKDMEIEDQWRTWDIISNLWHGTNPNTIKKILKKYKKFRLPLQFLHKHYFSHSTYERTEIIKMILLLKFHADKFKKIIVLPCFDDVGDEYAQKLNSKNFFILNEALVNKYHNDTYFRIPNHLMPVQHKLLFNFVSEKLKSD
jgi:hypothetical protein